MSEYLVNQDLIDEVWAKNKLGMTPVEIAAENTSHAGITTVRKILALSTPTMREFVVRTRKERAERIKRDNENDKSFKKQIKYLARKNENLRVKNAEILREINKLNSEIFIKENDFKKRESELCAKNESLESEIDALDSELEVAKQNTQIATINAESDAKIAHGAQTQNRILKVLVAVLVVLFVGAIFAATVL